MGTRRGWVNCYCTKNNATKKVVVNKCYGGFGLNLNAVVEIYKRKNNIDKAYLYKKPIDSDSDFLMKTNTCIDSYSTSYYMSIKDLGKQISYEENKDKLTFLWDNTYTDREDPDLIAVIEELGENECSNQFSQLRIVEIPADVVYEIDDYDGIETIHEVHRSW